MILRSDKFEKRNGSDYDRASQQKGKAIPVTLWRTHRLVRRRDSHIFYTIGSQMTVGCQPYAQAALYHQEDPWYSFLLEVESTPEP
jgi:hypothetical protein